jgi:hypothetical protein
VAFLLALPTGFVPLADLQAASLTDDSALLGPHTVLPVLADQVLPGLIKFAGSGVALGGDMAGVGAGVVAPMSAAMGCGGSSESMGRYPIPKRKSSQAFCSKTQAKEQVPEGKAIFSEPLTRFPTRSSLRKGEVEEDEHKDQVSCPVEMVNELHPGSLHA